MTTYIGNALSLNMVAHIGPHTLRVTPLALDAVKAALVGGAIDGGIYTGVPLAHGVIPAVGHGNTAAVIDGLLGLGVDGVGDTNVQFSTFGGRVNVALEMGDTLYVAQYVGPRLEEGATALPDGAGIDWFRVDVSP